MCGARVVLAHFNTLLAVIGGAALVACGVVGTGSVPQHAASVPCASVLLMAPYALGPLLLLLSHLAVTALHSAPSTARSLLSVYSALCALTALAAGGVAGWAGHAVTEWLRDDPLAPVLLRRDRLMSSWLQPFKPLMPEDKQSVFPEEKLQIEVILVLAVVALMMLVLVVNAVLALAARPRRLRDDEQALRYRPHSSHPPPHPHSLPPPYPSTPHVFCSSKSSLDLYY
ncbi:hypothetical protein O0L34_g5184 [Tuta absoluta]|nr:hypothetical protein O0L34_g5184 [Tuta absoluta]